MKIRSIICQVVVISALLVVAGRLGAASPEPLVSPVTTKSRPVLEKGMDAEAILKAIGKPAAVELMDKSGAKAEKWIYRRKTKETSIQTASDVIMEPAFTGFGGSGGPSIVDVPKVGYRLKHITVYQVTALLMVDQKLVLAKQWNEQDEKFVN